MVELGMAAVGPEPGAKTPRIVIAQTLSTAHLHFNMVVLATLSTLVYKAQTAAHAQVNHHGSALEL